MMVQTCWHHWYDEQTLVLGKTSTEKDVNWDESYKTCFPKNSEKLTKNGYWKDSAEFYFWCDFTDESQPKYIFRLFHRNAGVENDV